MRLRINPPRSRETLAFTAILFGLQILFIVFFLFHLTAKPSYETLLLPRNWPFAPLLNDIIGTFLVWGVWVGAVVLWVEAWIFRGWKALSFWLLLGVSTCVFGIEAGYLTALENFTDVTLSRALQGAMFYVVVFLLSASVVAIPLNIYSAVSKKIRKHTATE
jgi:hypothetical protein